MSCGTCARFGRKPHSGVLKSGLDYCNMIRDGTGVGFRPTLKHRGLDMRSIGCAVILLVGTAASANQLAPAEKDLVLSYPFDEGSGTVAKDTSPKNNNGKINGAKFVRLGDDWALQFDGVDDYVSCPITPSLDMKDVITVEAWVRPAGSSGNETAVVAQWPLFGLTLDAGTGRCHWHAPKGTLASPEDVLTQHRWHHLAGTYDHGRMSLFVDGELIATADSEHDTLGPRERKGKLWIGRMSEASDRFYEGRIGVVRIYHRALSPFEVGKRHDATRDVYLADSPPPPTRDYPAPRGDLAAYYTFDEGRGDTLRDQSGNENHGRINGARFVKAGMGHALRFDGKDDFVDCGNGPALDLTETVSLEAWVYPESIPTDHPGILGKGIGSYGLTYYVYGDCHLYISNGHQTAVGSLVPGTWQHVVGTFDGHNVRLYINGELKGSLLLDKKAPIRRDDRFLIGSRAPWDGSRAYFNGVIDEARIYNRSLSEDEVRAHYEDTRQAYGFSIVPAVYYFRGDIVTVLDYRGMGNLEQTTTASVAITRPGKEDVLLSKSIELRPGSNMDEVTIEVGDLSPGAYEVTAYVGDQRDAPMAVALPKTVIWPDKPDAPGARVLNNLVSELLTVKDPEAGRSYAFTNPRDGWVFLSAASAGADAMTLSLGADDEAPTAIEPFNESGNGAPLEVMRELSAGTYRLRVLAEHPVERLVVRSIPEIFFTYYPSGPFVRPFGPFDETFMEKHIYRNANCISSRIYNDCRDGPDHVKRWKREGRRWFAGRFDVPNISGKPFTVDGVADYILEDGEYEDPFIDGVIASEFFSGDDPKLTTWAEAVRKVHARYPKKKFYPWCHAFYSGPHGHTFIRALQETGNKYLWERYLREQPTKMEAYLYLNNSLIQTMHGWRTVPGAERNLVVCFGIFNTPHPSLDASSNVDFKVLMDMRYNIVVNHPAFRDLGGVMEYNTYHATRESLRWAGKLWRHYCIEGNTGMLSDRYGFTYALDHIRNGDFERGTTGWTLSPAATDSMALRNMPGSGSMMHGAWPSTPGEGDDFIWMKRVAAKPNVLSQRIEHLEAGRLYSVRVITADYGDFSAGRSVEKAHAVSIEIDDAEIIPEVSFSHVKDMAGRAHPPFEPPAYPWINYHYRVFRAKAETSTLRLSDWQDRTEPGGPIGQELMFGTIELAPYLED